MKKLTMTEWEKEYVIGPIERFDQINTMTRRRYADPLVKVKLDGLSAPEEVKQEPGFTQQDYALRWATRYYHSLLTELNDSKPNASPLSKEIRKVIDDSNQALSYPLRVNEDTKIDISNIQTITRDVKKAATFFGADLVGICKLDRRWTYSHTCEKGIGDSEPFVYKNQEIPEEFQYAVVMGFEPDYEMLKHVQTSIGAAAHDRASTDMVVTGASLTRFIHYLGFNAIDSNLDDVVMTVPMAMQAGLGQIGRHGLLITPWFGPRIRLSTVITNLPLLPDSPIDFGVTEFCDVCKKCADKCPGQAISQGKRTSEPTNIANSSGGLKWPQNGELCLLRAARYKYPCSSCVSVCPYNKQYTWFHRVVRWFTDHMRWADSLVAKMDNLLGYGKIKRADDFWRKWKPLP